MARHSDHDRIAHKAHELWEAEGRPHGRNQAHWDQAREIIALEDSQKATLLPRTKGAKKSAESPKAALRNLADVPGLTDQGENLLTSTDREPDLTATPSGRRGKMPKAAVPISDQPGMPAKTRKATGKASEATGAAKPAGSSEANGSTAAQPKTAAAPKRTKSDASATAPSARRTPARKTAE